jgi:hypothetical protein
VQKARKKALAPTSGHLYLSETLLAIAIGFEMSSQKNEINNVRKETKFKF